MNNKSSKIEKLLPLLKCPETGSALTIVGDFLCNLDQSRKYPIQGEQIFFIEGFSVNDPLDHLKYKLKKWFGRYYYQYGVALLAPTYPFNYLKEIQKHCDLESQVVVDLGSGNVRLHPNLITVDATAYDAVDIIADATNLPFKDDIIDGFTSRSVLEHIPDVEKSAKEMLRSTKQGGIALHSVPFLYPFHASPHDYHRFTHKGIELLFDGCSTKKLSNLTGPFTLLTLYIVEFASYLLSFGFIKVKAILSLVIGASLFWLKFFDFPFIGRSQVRNFAPNLLYVGVKK